MSLPVINNIDYNWDFQLRLMHEQGYKRTTEHGRFLDFSVTPLWTAWASKKPECRFRHSFLQTLYLMTDDRGATMLSKFLTRVGESFLDQPIPGFFALFQSDYYVSAIDETKYPMPVNVNIRLQLNLTAQITQAKKPRGMKTLLLCPTAALLLGDSCKCRAGQWH